MTACVEMLALRAKLNAFVNKSRSLSAVLRKLISQFDRSHRFNDGSEDFRNIFRTLRKATDRYIYISFFDTSVISLP